MSTNKETKENQNRKTILSTLWIVLMFNFTYGDIYTLMYPEELNAILSGYAGTLKITQSFLLQGAIYVELAIIMIFLSRVLGYRANRLTNIIVAVINIAAVISSMFMGTSPTYSYIFFGVIETILLALIIWYAWRWTNPEKALV
jgi:hypothetical protein